MKKLRRVLIVVALVLGSAAVALVAERYGGLTGVEELELTTLDWRQVSTAGSRQAGSEASEIVLVLFDEDATRDWPWLSPYPREELARLVTTISEAGAGVIGLDVFLAEQYPNLPGDEALRGALGQAGNVVLVGPIDDDVDPPVLERPDPYFADVALDVGAADLPTPFGTIRDGSLLFRTAEGLVPSWALTLYAHHRGLDLDSLLAASAETGRIELPGLPRRLGEFPEEWETGEGYALAFPLRFVGPPTTTVAEEGGTFNAVSSAQAQWMPVFDPGFYRDKIVLLGTGFHDQDKFRTPFYDQPIRSRVADTEDGEGTAGGEGAAGGEGESAAEEGGSTAGEGGSTAASGEAGGPVDRYGWMFGVEVHANALQNLLDWSYVRPLGVTAKLLILLVVAGAAAGAVFWKGAVAGAVAALLATLGVWAGAFWAFAGQIFLPGVTSVQLGDPYLWVPIITLTLGVWVSYLMSTAWVSVVEGREKRFIKGAFGKYVSPAVVHRISENPESLQLGGQRRPLSVLFSDLAGFTTLSEDSEPEDLVALLNEYLSEMTELVLEEGGTLDKYIGDAIMAFWNAPVPVPDHADRALRCAIFMQRKMDSLNERWRAAERLPRDLVVRIGINTGDTIVGNVGGKDRFDYSCIGDPVNLAARLEPANKTYDTLVMASEFTVDACDRDRYRLRELDLVAVKGKSRPVTVYEVVELATQELPPDVEEMLEHYEQGLAAYRRRDFDLALQYFSAAVEARAEDGPSALYVERCREYMENPPPTDWDFVVRRESK